MDIFSPTILDNALITGSNNANLLQVSSPTAPAALFISGSGRVGIGTTSPTQRLDVRDGFIQVSGSGASGYGYLLNRAGQDTYSIRHLDGGLTINNETDSVKEMTFLGNGNIGINEINPSARLEIRGSGATSATTALRVENSSAAASLVVLDNGNAGIGTATPSTTLQVAGTSSLQNIVFDTNNTYDIGTITTRARNIWSNGNVVGINSFFNSAVMYNSARIGGDHTATALLHISSSDSAQMMRINSPTNANILFVSGSGNIGVGTTTPGVTLDVVGSIRASNTMFNTVTQTRQITINSANQIQFFSASVETARYDNNGWGFFNNAPAAKVHISGANADALFRVSSPSASAALFISGSGNVGIGTATPTGVIDVFQGGNSRILVKADDGFVGIQQPSPTERIHITSDPATSKYLRIDAAQATNPPPRYLPAVPAKEIYGQNADDFALGTPDYWMEIILNGNIVLIPCYLPN
jgi:hypothetical protein